MALLIPISERIISWELDLLCRNHEVSAKAKTAFVGIENLGTYGRGGANLFGKPSFRSRQCPKSGAHLLTSRARRYGLPVCDA